MSEIKLRNMGEWDCQIISDAFKMQGWDKPVKQYERYFKQMHEGIRDVILAEYDGAFAGYVNIEWMSGYKPFKEANIPEITDLNVLEIFQRKGIATKLMDEAENRIKSVSRVSGIGVGLYPDYGKAQRMYIKRGYIPDGRGINYDCKILERGEHIILDDSLCLMLTKIL